MTQHLVFYDGECGLCDHAVQVILRADKRAQFMFAPLKGETASHYLHDVSQGVIDADSLILIENYTSDNRTVYIYGEGALRIAWLLGNFWKLLGVAFFLPSWLYNWLYRLVARNRHRFFEKGVCRLPLEKERDRFLP